MKQAIAFVSWLTLVSATPIDHAGTTLRRKSDRQLQSFNGAVTMLNLVRSDSDSNRTNLVNNMVFFNNQAYNFDPVPNYNINATVSGPDVKSVLFSYNTTRNHKIENGAPFAFCGNSGTDFYRCNRLGYGTHTVTATPYSALNARGTAGTPMKVTFTIRPRDWKTPTVTALVASPTTVDLTNGGATVNFTFTVQDPSGVVGGALAVWSFNSNVSFAKTVKFGEDVGEWDFRAPIIGPINDKPTTYTVPFDFPQYLGPGVFQVLIYPSDQVGNDGDPYEGTFTITNSNPDIETPKLLSFKPLFDYTVVAPRTELSFEIVVQDNLSGIVRQNLDSDSSLSVFCHSCDYFEGEGVEDERDTVWVALGGTEPLAGNGIPHTLRVNVTLPVNFFTQCEFFVRLSDKVNNNIDYSGGGRRNAVNMVDLGFPGFWKAEDCDRGW